MIEDQIERRNLVFCKKCGKDEPQNEIHLHHLFPKAHAIICGINADAEGRVYLCKECHTTLHYMLGMECKRIGEEWIKLSIYLHN